MQLVFAICAFAPIAQSAGWPRADYALFTGITAMLLALLWIVGMVRQGQWEWLKRRTQPGQVMCVQRNAGHPWQNNLLALTSYLTRKSAAPLLFHALPACSFWGKDLLGGSSPSSSTASGRSSGWPALPCCPRTCPTSTR